MVFMLGISVVYRMRWHSAGLASKDSSANDFASLSPGLLGGTWGFAEPYRKLSCSLHSPRRLAKSELMLCSAVLIIVTINTMCQALC